MAMRPTPLTCSGHTRPVVDLAFSGITPYGYFLISACKDGKPMLRQGDTGDWIGTFLGHKGAVWGATLNKDATKAATAAADFTAKVWDAVSGDELMTLAHKHIVKTVDFTQRRNIPGSCLSCVVVALFSYFSLSLFSRIRYSLDPIKSFEAPATINSASLHPEKEFLVAGGEDFKLYKYDYNSGEELESYKGHFGPIHCVRFSPDGELYASGSEDGTLRLWQTVVGKTYGLWKCVLPEEDSGELAKPKIGFPETTEEELEEIASENSDSIYSSTPEVKA
ncbi:Serine-threonine kinase receptor-associated protein [Tupaia chinensis]|uniref:Serine-threonine kinase receptor-associated protein n=1 Tax=Tupaia chinensis TaxID=246437 RepID=L8Y8E7_TUPCH|nr:Serine-threonine kinase receptor-associated protein [Tupaia chinensis]